jgi:hypothetical protein
MVPRCPRCKGDNLFFVRPPEGRQEAIYKCPDCGYQGSGARLEAPDHATEEETDKQGHRHRIAIKMAIVLLVAFLATMLGVAYLAWGLPFEYLYATPIVVFGAILIYFAVMRKR